MGKHSGIVFIIFLLATASAAAAQVDVSRSLSTGQVSPGGSVQVSLRVSVSGVQEGLIITEAVPEGWRVSKADPPIDKDSGNELKWLFIGKNGVSGDGITYYLTSPAAASGNYQVTGSWMAVNGGGQENFGSSPASSIAVLGAQQPSGTGGGSGGGGGGGAPRSSEEEDREICRKGARSCNGNNIVACPDGSEWVLVESCEFGCRFGECLKVPGEELEQEEVGETWLEPTGMFTLDNPSLLAGILGVIVVVVGAALLFVRRKPKQKQEEPEGPFRYEYLPGE